MVGFLAGLVFVVIIPLPVGFQWLVRSTFWLGKSFWRSLLLVWAFYRWLTFRRFILLSLGFCALVLLFYVEEDLRGWWTWQHFKHEWEAKGERFDYASIILPPVPDNQNFALTPIVASCYENMLTKSGTRITPFKTNVVNRLWMTPGDYSNYAERPDGNLDWAKGQPTDLKAWQDFYRELASKTNQFSVPAVPQSPAADVLLALGKYDSTIEELRDASALPYSRFPLNYDTNKPFATLLMHLSSLKSCVETLRLREVAELENGQSDKALDNVKLSLRLINATRNEPFPSSHYERTRELDYVFQPIWEGLTKHEWSEPQLVVIEEELGKLDFLADSQLTMRGERNEVFAAAYYFRRVRPYHEFRQMFAPLVSYMSPGPDDLRRLEREETYKAITMCLVPSGWFYQYKLVIGKTYQQWSLQTTDPAKHLAFPEMARNGRVFLDSLSHRPWNVFARMSGSGFEGANLKLIYAQEMTDLARIACALERYRLAHGQYSDDLAELAPQYIEKIPHDIIGGQPLHYHRADDGKYLLYSIGWNEKDDGGTIGMVEGFNHLEITMGDWVWPCR